MSDHASNSLMNAFESPASQSIESERPPFELKPDRRAGSIRRSVAIALLALAGSAIALAIAWIIGCCDRASPQPSPLLEVSDSEDGFPYVDWDYWQSVNPDVIAWVSVPGTNIDQPVVKSSGEDPDFYLDHDVYRKFNPMGVPFLDSDCTDSLESPNALIYGHHWDGGQVFADFANFTDEYYAEGHSTVLVQTPAWRRIQKVISVEVASGDAKTKRTQFSSKRDFSLWLEGRYDSSIVRLAGDLGLKQEMPDSVITFCTCSYMHDNDRTLVYTAEG